MAGVRTTEGGVKLEVKVAAGLGLAALGLGICGWLFGDVNQHDGQPVPGSGDTGPTAGEVTPDVQATIGLAEGVPSETNDWFLGSPLPAETSTATAILTLIPENGAGGAVFTADIGEQLQQRLEANLALPVCNQSGNQSADGDNWMSPQAAKIEAQGGNIQDLYDLLRSKLPNGSVRLCANTEGWYFRVAASDGAPYWNQVRGEDGQWRWADHPNLIPVDAEGNIGEWRPVRLPSNGSSVWAPLVLGGVPVEVQLDRNGRPAAYFDPVSGEMISLLPLTPIPPTETLAPATATEKPTAEVRPSPKPTPVPSPTPTPEQPMSPELQTMIAAGWPPNTEIVDSGLAWVRVSEPLTTIGDPKEAIGVADCRDQSKGCVFAPEFVNVDFNTVKEAWETVRNSVGEEATVLITYGGNPSSPDPSRATSAIVLIFPK